jgi:hypothetical protein
VELNTKMDCTNKMRGCELDSCGSNTEASGDSNIAKKNSGFVKIPGICTIYELLISSRDGVQSLETFS